MESDQTQSMQQRKGRGKDQSSRVPEETVMPRRRVALLLVAEGLLILIASAGADNLGIGHTFGFGWQQTAGTVVGAVILILGIWLLLQA